MLLVFLTGLLIQRAILTRIFMIGGCVGSGFCLIALGIGGLAGSAWPLVPNVMALGFCNGVFAVAAIATMMGLAAEGEVAREGTRMGVFGAAQSLGFAIGASFGAAALDALRGLLDALAPAYASVFIFEGALFLVAAVLAWHAVSALSRPAMPAAIQIPGE